MLSRAMVREVQNRAHSEVVRIGTGRFDLVIYGAGVDYKTYCQKLIRW